MKKLFLLLYMLPILCSGQKITIDNDYVVGRSYLDIIKKKHDKKVEELKAEIMVDEYHKDSLVFYFITKPYVNIGLMVTFRKDSIIPRFYHWDDGIHGLIRLDFDSYELILSSDHPKNGDRLRGKFKGVATEISPDGSVAQYYLSGKFSHTIEDTFNKQRQERQLEEENLSKKMYLKTGIYHPAIAEAGMSMNMPTYTLAHTDKEFYIYNTRDFEQFMCYSKAIAEPDKKNSKLTNIKFVIDSGFATIPHGVLLRSKFALIVDDTLIYIGESPEQNATSVTIPVGLGKEEVNKLIKKLNMAMQLDMKNRKAAGKKMIGE